MNRKKILNRLKVACVIAGVLGLGLFGGAAPWVVGQLPSGRGGADTVMYWVDLGYIWLVGALSFASLWEAWKICVQIGRDNSFSMQNVVSLRRISRWMAVACGLMTLGLVIFLLGVRNWMVLGLIGLGICISLIFSLFASALAELIRMGAELKDENDLTI